MKNGSYFSQKPTVGFDQYFMKGKDKNASLVRFVDTSGQIKILNDVMKLFKNADLLVLAYDCTDRSTFEDIPDLIKNVSELIEKNI
jgi:ribosomal protein L7Ae-like RNA K-turn-binding protein